jgi:glycosyltransferase involved in cell wall biosynthesis
MQIGAREHYAVPRMLHELGLLRRMYTDVYAGPGSALHLPIAIARRLGFGKRLKKLSDRTSPLPKEKVRANNLLGLQKHLSLRNSSTVLEETREFHDFQNQLSRWTVGQMTALPDAIVGFRGSDELFRLLHANSACILDQIDGAVYEVDIIKREQQAYPNWPPAHNVTNTSEATGEESWLAFERVRLAREWKLADIIVCNSNWTKTCLKNMGVDQDKCVVVPLAYEVRTSPRQARTNTNEAELRIGFLGTLTLRKGIHLLLEACRAASQSATVKVLAAGVLDISQSKLGEFADVLDWRGVIPRSELDAFFDEIDVLALPSISEGFGIVQLEAISRGVPVICSERAGEVIRNGIEGLIVPAGDVRALTEALLSLASNPARVQQMGAAASVRANDFSSSIVAQKWAAVVEQAIEIFKERSRNQAGTELHS